MDREQREQRDQTFNEMLWGKMEANRGGVTLEDLMGRRSEEGVKPRSNETGRGGRES